jgi:3-methyladenine DNA glycosylase AlkC
VKTGSSPSIPPEILSRKGATKTSLVPAAVRELLDRGLIESMNLCEWLVIDHGRLAENVFPTIGCESLVSPLKEALSALETPTALKRTQLVGQFLADASKRRAEFLAKVKTLQTHTSDTVRGWACMMIGHHASASLAEKLQWMDQFAADPNMGVREMAWLALRPAIAEDLHQAIGLLEPWTTDSRDRVRRFASESTRPRGVWCSHIDALKRDPPIGLSLLEPLKADPSKYVRDSVANWLNDASKSSPDFAIETCKRWLQESPCAETKIIIRRSLRTLKKAGNSAANAILKKT